MKIWSNDFKLYDLKKYRFTGKKCQAIEDQRYNTTIEYYRYYDKIVEGKTKYKNVNDSPELEALNNKADSFTKQLRALHCI